MSKALLRSAAFAACVLSSAACARDDAPASVTIADYAEDEHENMRASARYEIIIHSGAGIPGSPGAQDYYRQPRQVLQAIVDRCGLGRTLYLNATDGVSILTIVNSALREDQVACIRSAEDNGLRLNDRGGVR